jgi:hypothetical protein
MGGIFGALALTDVPGVLGGFFAIGASGYGFARWLNRPKLFCGIPPSETERRSKGIAAEKLGRFSLTHEFLHADTLFAKRLRSTPRRLKRLVMVTGRKAGFKFDSSARELPIEALTERERARLLAHASCREVRCENGIATLPVVMINRGARCAVDYHARILIYHPGSHRVHTRSLVSEELDFYIYADKPELVDESMRRAGRTADPAIVSAYNKYLVGAERWGDGIWLSGNLAAHTYEMILATIEIDDGATEFYLLYMIDSADAWIRASTYIQACEVKQSNG